MLRGRILLHPTDDRRALGRLVLVCGQAAPRQDELIWTPAAQRLRVPKALRYRAVPNGPDLCVKQASPSNLELVFAQSEVPQL
jgi:hypothetical protein